MPLKTVKTTTFNEGTISLISTATSSCLTFGFGPKMIGRLIRNFVFVNTKTKAFVRNVQAFIFNGAPIVNLYSTSQTDGFS